MRTKILKAILYPLFFLACLIFFVIQGFPVEQIAQRMAREAHKRTGLEVAYNGVETLFPNGLEVEGLTLSGEPENGGTPMLIQVDQVSARVSLFSLLAGVQDVSFSAEALAGKLEGDFRLDDGAWKLDTRLSGLNLARLTFLGAMLGQELTGKVNGNIELHVDPKDIKATRGEINLDLVQGQIGNGKIYGVTLPWISLGRTQASINIEKGKAEIKSLKVSSDDVEASLDGYFILQQKLEHLSSHCKVRFKLSDEKMGEIRKQIPPEFHAMLDRELDRAKGQDGYYRYSIFGRLFGGKPQFRPLKQ